MSLNVLELGKEKEMGRFLFECKVCLRFWEGSSRAHFGSAVLVWAKDVFFFSALVVLLTALDTLVRIFLATLASQIGFYPRDLDLSTASAIVPRLVKLTSAAGHLSCVWIWSDHLLQFG